MGPNRDLLQPLAAVVVRGFSRAPHAAWAGPFIAAAMPPPRQGHHRGAAPRVPRHTHDESAYEDAINWRAVGGGYLAFRPAPRTSAEVRQWGATAAVSLWTKHGTESGYAGMIWCRFAASPWAASRKPRAQKLSPARKIG